MKVILSGRESQAYFGLLDDLPIPDLQIVCPATPEDLLVEVVDADVLYGTPTAEVLSAAGRLSWIQSHSAGVDYLMRLPQLLESEVVLTNTRGAHAPAIAEHVFACLLALTRRLPACLEWQARSYWGWAEGYRTLREIKGAKMGIVGYGAIGRAVAQRAHAFEMELRAVDARPGDGAPWLDEVWPPSRLPELLEGSTAVVIAVPFTTETHHLIDAPMLARLNPDAYLIAVSRGGIVDESALAAALVAGRLAGAALDVAENEPLPSDSPLWKAPNLIITPHLAGDSDPKERRCVEILCENLVRFANGEPLLNVVDKRLGY